jgi:DNA topoisomerase-1
LCNHQRSVSKGHSAQMERLEGKMTEMEALLEELEVDLDRAKRGKPPLRDSDGKVKKNQNPEA